MANFPSASKCEPDASGPSYVIYRDVPLGEAFDPNAPPTFFPPKGSDELFDALRAKFPHLRTHAERMRDAIIEFLLEERQTLEMSNAVTSTSAYGPSQSTPSVFSSPGTLVSTPTSASLHSSTDQLQSPTSGPTPPVTRADKSSPPLSMDQMTGVFSLSVHPQPKQRSRRKMTDAEKAEYRKRRIVKACNQCARRKRKCHHNQPAMQSVESPAVSDLPVAGRRTNSATTVAPLRPRRSPPQLDWPSPDDPPPCLPYLGGVWDDPFATAYHHTSEFEWEDLDMFDEPFPAMDLDDILRLDELADYPPNRLAASPSQRFNVPPELTGGYRAGSSRLSAG